MGWLDRLIGKAPTGAQSLAVVGDSKYMNNLALQASGLRSGMWVVTSGGTVGIVTGCSAEAVVEVTVTKPDGNTQMTLNDQDQAVPLVVLSALDTLRQAYIDEVPEARRHCGTEALRAMGYKERGAA